MSHQNPKPDMSAACQVMALEIHGECVRKLLGFLRQDEADLLARWHELEAELDAVGLDTPEAIRDRLDASASARERVTPKASRPTLRVSPLRWGKML